MYRTVDLLKYIRHDDLKPNNILIHGSNVLLTDFGVWYDQAYAM